MHAVLSSNDWKALMRYHLLLMSQLWTHEQEVDNASEMRLGGNSVLS